MDFDSKYIPVCPNSGSLRFLSEVVFKLNLKKSSVTLFFYPARFLTVLSRWRRGANGPFDKMRQQ